MNPTKAPARLIPSEIIPALRLSKPLPLPEGASSGTCIQVVHGDEFVCTGYLVRRYWRGENNYSGFITGMERPNREYFVFTKDMVHATRLASMDENTLKNAYQMPEPILNLR